MGRKKDTKSTTEKESSIELGLLGIDSHYKTTISDGDRRVEGRGRTPEESQKVASKKWDRKE